MDPAHTLQAQVTMFQEQFLLVLPREIYFKQKLALYPPILEQLLSELWGMYHFTVFVTTWHY